MEAQVEVYRRQYATLRELAGPRSFLVTHRPMWAFGVSKTAGSAGMLFRDNPTLQAASFNEVPSGVEAVLSGHIHIFELLGFVEPRPPQVVVGNSGTELDPAVTTPLEGLEIGNARVAVGETRDAFGFITLEAQGSGWLLTLRDLGGSELRECTIAGLEVACP